MPRNTTCMSAQHREDGPQIRVPFGVPFIGMPYYIGDLIKKAIPYSLFSHVVAQHLPSTEKDAMCKITLASENRKPGCQSAPGCLLDDPLKWSGLSASRRRFRAQGLQSRTTTLNPKPSTLNHHFTKRRRLLSQAHT